MGEGELGVARPSPLLAVGRLAPLAVEEASAAAVAPAAAATVDLVGLPPQPL